MLTGRKHSRTHKETDKLSGDKLPPECNATVRQAGVGPGVGDTNRSGVCAEPAVTNVNKGLQAAGPKVARHEGWRVSTQCSSTGREKTESGSDPGKRG